MRRLARERLSKTLVGLAMLLVVCVLAGCTARMRFYVVQGPLSSAAPSPVFLGKLSGPMNMKAGSFSAILDGGETFAGKWALVPQSAGAVDATPLPAALAGGMSSAWDAVFGQGFYTSHVLGQRVYGRGIVTGGKGSMLELELCMVGNESGGTKAVAIDDKGNVYKVVLFL